MFYFTKPEYDEKIPLEAEVIRTIIKAIESADFLFKDFMREEDFDTDNGADSFIWNFYNRAITNALPADRFQIPVEQRGCWKFPEIYDKKTGYLYTLMRETRLAHLRNNASSEMFHYTNVLSKLNDSLSDSYCLANEQMNLFEPNYSPDDNDMLENILKSLTGQLDGPVNRYVLIAFNIVHGQVSMIKGVVPAIGMQYFNEEMWTDLKQVTYPDTGEDVQPADNDSIILLERKPNVHRKAKHDAEKEINN